MRSRITARFRRAFAELPAEVKERARDAGSSATIPTTQVFDSSPFKRVHPTDPVYSVRIGLGYRAAGIREGDTIYWFWIGSHADYDRLIS